RSQVGPGASASKLQLVLIDALPGASAHGFYGSAADLVISWPAIAVTDLDQTYSYANPFSTGGVAWDEFAIVAYWFDVPVLAAGATAPWNASVGAFMHRPLAAITGGTIAPLVTPVRNVKIAGMDLSTAKTGVGATPIITWDPPTTGRPTSY